VPSAYLSATIRHYQEQPEHRSAIGTEAELARLHATQGDRWNRV
jgi:hypothetical protein